MGTRIHLLGECHLKVKLTMHNLLQFVGANAIMHPQRTETPAQSNPDCFCFGCDKSPCSPPECIYCGTYDASCSGGKQTGCFTNYSSACSCKDVCTIMIYLTDAIESLGYSCACERVSDSTICFRLSYCRSRSHATDYS